MLKAKRIFVSGRVGGTVTRGTRNAVGEIPCRFESCTLRSERSEQGGKGFEPQITPWWKNRSERSERHKKPKVS